MNNIKIYNKFNFDGYIKLLTDLNIHLDIYYNPQFLEIDARIHNGEYEIFVFKTDESVFIYPYIKLFFKEQKFKGYFDITSPYGYSGPYSTNKPVFDAGEEAFLEYISPNCITEFVRYHFLYNEKLKFSRGIVNLKNRTIVNLDLNLTWEQIWTKEFSGTNRNLTRKLEKENYAFLVTDKKEDFDCFIEMYYSTMNNVAADSFYYFDKETIRELYSSLGNKIFLAKVQKDSIVYSYSLFFISGGVATYYLSARNIEYPKVPATNFLLAKATSFLLKKNVSIFNLGGGLTDEMGDYLFKFKKNFSKRTSEFYIGKRIHNNNKYSEITEDWISIHGNKEFESKKKILQFYR